MKQSRTKPRTRCTHPQVYEIRVHGYGKPRRPLRCPDCGAHVELRVPRGEQQRRASR